MLEEKPIPYFDHNPKSLRKTIQSSSRRRGISPFCFLLRKLKNTLLGRWAYNCSINSLRVKMQRKRGVSIGENVYIGVHTMIDNAYPEYVYIDNNVSLAGNVTVVAHSNPYAHFSNVLEASVAPIHIKEGAWIADGAIILKGVTVGCYAIVTAGTVVDKSVPDFSIAQGNPMKIVANFEEIF